MLVGPNQSARVATRRLSQLSRTLRSSATFDSITPEPSSATQTQKTAMAGPYERRHKVTVVGSGNWYSALYVSGLHRTNGRGL